MRDTTYVDLLRQRNEIDHIIHTDVEKKVEREISKGCKNYPIRFSSKVKVLYGDEAEQIYNELVNLK